MEKHKPELELVLTDPHFKCEINFYSTAVNGARGIWHAQHQTVAEDFVSVHDFTPDRTKAEQAIITHQLKHEHWSVLKFAFVHFHFGGFPHDTAMQIARHQDSQILVESGRYTYKRFVDFQRNVETVPDFDWRCELKKLFYFRPLGTYRDRTGATIEYTQQWLETDLQFTSMCVSRFVEKIAAGFPAEFARHSSLPQNFRQHFHLAGTIEAFFHWLDQRSKADTQLETQAVAVLALREFKEWYPELARFYNETRWGRARLAP